MLLALAGCIRVSVCAESPEECPLAVTLRQGVLELGRGGTLDVRVGGLADLGPLSARLYQPGVQPVRSLTALRQVAESDSFLFFVKPGDVAGFALGVVELEMTEAGRVGEARVPLVSGLRLGSSPVSAAGVAPTIERLGFASGKLLSFLSATVSMQLNKRFAKYTTTESMFTQDMSPQGFVFTNVLKTALPTAAFGSDRVVWLEKVDDGVTGLPKGMGLTNCPLGAGAVTDCANPSSAGYANNLLPLDYKGFAVSPSADRAVVAQGDGMLKAASLPTQTVSPPPLMWKAVSGQPNPTRMARVLLAMGDLNGDGQADLMAVHQDGSGQDVTVYLGQGGVWSYDVSASKMWQTALGSAAVEAIALGDLDSDGRAEVVAGTGRNVTVWQTTKNGEAPYVSWSTELSVMNVMVRALAIGSVDGKGNNDLVVSATGPDSMGNVIQYLHAFFAQ